MSGIVCAVHRIVSECGPFQGNIYPEDYIPASCVLGTKHSSCWQETWCVRKFHRFSFQRKFSMLPSGRPCSTLTYWRRNFLILSYTYFYLWQYLQNSDTCNTVMSWAYLTTLVKSYVLTYLLTQLFFALLNHIHLQVSRLTLVLNEVCGVTS